MTARGRLRPGRTAASLAVNLVLMAFSLSCVFPVVWMLYSSFKTSREFSANVLALPATLNLENYRQVLAGGQLVGFFLNSMRSTLGSLVFIVLLGFVVGYFLARYRFRGKTLISLLLLAGMLVPIHALIVPMYIQFLQFGLSNHRYTLLLPYVSFGLPIGVFLTSSYVKGIPPELESAAAIDGAGFTRTLFTIILPVATPVLVTVGIIQFFACWNEFTFALILVNDPGLFTIPVGVNLFKGQFTSDYTRMMALMLLAIAPALLLYFLFSRHIINGMVAGAVKG